MCEDGEPFEVEMPLVGLVTYGLGLSQTLAYFVRQQREMISSVAT